MVLQDLFTFQNHGMDENGRVVGELTATGIRPGFADRFETLGVSTAWDGRRLAAVLH